MKSCGLLEIRRRYESGDWEMQIRWGYSGTVVDVFTISALLALAERSGGNV
jgi:hypothetical protein